MTCHVKTQLHVDHTVLAWPKSDQRWLTAYVISATRVLASPKSHRKRLHLPSQKEMAQPILTSTIILRRQSPSRSSFLLFPWTQSLRCLHTTTVRPRSAAYQSISTRQPAQASPMLLAKQQYLKTRIKDLGILPGMYKYPARKRPQASFLYVLVNIYLYYREKKERERESKKTKN